MHLVKKNEVQYKKLKKMESITIYYNRDYILLFNGNIKNPCKEKNHFVAEGKLYRRQLKNPIKKFTGTIIKNCEGIVVENENLRPLKKTSITNKDLMLFN